MADRITYTPGRKPYTMKNKARFARLINQRLEALDRPAAWLARQVGQYEANIARWRDENVQAMPRDPDVVWRLAKALDMDVAERDSFFEAAGLHVPPVQADMFHTQSHLDPNRIKTPSPRPLSPTFEVTAGQLGAELICPQPWEGEPELHWDLLLELYVVPPSEAPMIIPFHRCTGSIEFQASDLRVLLKDFVILAPGTLRWIPRRTCLRSHAVVTSSLGVNVTTTEAMVVYPGVVYLRAKGWTDDANVERSEQARVTISVIVVPIKIRGEAGQAAVPSDSQ